MQDIFTLLFITVFSRIFMFSCFIIIVTDFGGNVGRNGKADGFYS